MLLLAVVKALEIVGEAAARITKERQAKISQIPWPQMISMRNRLIHAYFDIDTDVVWETIVEDLPELIRELEKVTPQITLFIHHPTIPPSPTPPSPPCPPPPPVDRIKLSQAAKRPA